MEYDPWGRRWARRIGIALATVVTVVVGTFFFLVRTSTGQNAVFDLLLPRAQGVVDGRILVDGVRSRDLRTGVTLLGLRIEGPDGAPVLVADSVRARYRWRDFLAGEVRLAALELYTPVFFLAQETPEARFNVERLLAGADTAAEAAPAEDGGGVELDFRNVRVVDGTVRVATPAGEDTSPRAVVLPGEGDGPDMVRWAFEAVQADLPRLFIGDEDAGVTARIDALALDGQVFESPFRLERLRGDLEWVGDTLTVRAERLELPATSASGTFRVGLGDPAGVVLGAELRADSATLADLRWIEPRLPEGVARGGVGLVLAPDRQEWRLDELALRGPDVALVANGGATVTAGGPAFEDLVVTFDRSRLEPWEAWVPLEEIPLEGTLEGRLAFDGPAGAVQGDGELTFRAAGDTTGGSLRATLGGTLHLDGPFAVTGARVELDSLDWSVLRPWLPGTPLSGTGRVVLEGTGSLDTGLRFTADVTHRAPDAGTSQLLARGSFTEMPEGVALDVNADLAPLSFPFLRTFLPELELSGEARGSVRMEGRLADARISTDLETDAGRLALSARVNLRNPVAGYRVEGDVTRFRVSALLPELPDPTEYTGHVYLEGRGADPASMQATARLRARDSRVGGLRIDTATVDARIAGGRLQVDTVDAEAGGLDIRGRGSLGMAADSLGVRPSDGSLRFAFGADSIGRLRPLFMGEDIIVQDTLETLDRELLLLEGVDPDTLPRQAEVRFAGAARGEVTLQGALDRFSAEGELFLERGGYGESALREARLTFEASELPSLAGQVQARLEADSLVFLDRSFSRAEVEVDYQRPEGTTSIFLARSDEEDYRARAVVDVDTAGGRVQLEEMVLRMDTLRWQLEDRATVAWAGSGITISDLSITRPGPDPMRLFLDGTLPREGQADFRFEADGVSLSRMARFAQREELGVEGRLGARLRIQGTAGAPRMEGRIDVDSLAWDSYRLSRLDGEVAYRDRSLDLDIEAWDEDIRVVSATGSVPLDLSLRDVEDRIGDREMDIEVTADSLPATYVVGFLEALEEVEGTVSGDFRIRGTVEEPEPTGTLELTDAGWYMTALGVQYRDVDGTLTVRSDGMVEVQASAATRGGDMSGTARVDGTIGLEPLDDPTFDLTIEVQDFRAIDRRDVEGNVSGEVALTGSFRSPLVQGLAGQDRGLEVDQGVLYLEELVRSATVVDLSDPRFIGVVDTTFIQARPIIAQSQNPFLQNLRVNVDLTVGGQTWLRSEEMNVEIGGELVVTYDRQSADLVMVGELQAVRGEYTVLGRRFRVAGGQVEFVGTPGINPNLDIQAETEVRRIGTAEPLTITANVSGTLNDPQVSLGSPDEALAQSDLVSYLVFGQPSSSLASGQQRVLSGAGGALVQGLGGTLGARLGNVLARETGIDYLAISQPTELLQSGAASTFAQTTVEAGLYLEEDLFAILVLRPLSQLGGSSSGVFGGARLEWSATDAYTIEMFIEDRFLRNPSFGLREFEFDTTLVPGFFVFREWGY